MKRQKILISKFYLFQMSIKLTKQIKLKLNLNQQKEHVKISRSMHSK